MGMFSYPDKEGGGAGADVTDVIEIEALEQLTRAHSVLDDDALGRLEVLETAPLQSVLARLTHPDAHVLPVLVCNKQIHTHSPDIKKTYDLSNFPI